MVLLFRGGKGRAAPDATRELARHVRELLELPDEATVSVTEFACGDPACGGAETAIIVMRPGHRTEHVKLLMPVSSVSDDALRSALAPLVHSSAVTQ
ncbi:MAG TPA: hypothetical protein VIG34_06635 [Xanthobacteraceae bacterium]